MTENASKHTNGAPKMHENGNRKKSRCGGSESEMGRVVFFLKFNKRAI